MSRLLVPFLALILAAIVPLATPAQAAPQDQVARATSTEPTARQHPRHHRTSSAHNTQHRHTQHAHRTSTTHHRAAHSRTHQQQQRHTASARRTPRTTSPT